MRELKFRAWNNRKKEWIDPRTFACTKEGVFAVRGLATNWVHIMQFTGLFDCTGREIYDGDILRHVPDGNAPHWPVVVRWDLFAWWYGNDLLKPTVDATHQVIGNIYENPELLN
ncbi:MAG: hypothetical protein KGZ73_05290 [Rhizobiales bacterium]|nr:hypothetical protein [Hyphomicrobiales bacterium]